jgi:hypothetical protein
VIVVAMALVVAVLLVAVVAAFRDAEDDDEMFAWIDADFTGIAVGAGTCGGCDVCDAVFCASIAVWCNCSDWDGDCPDQGAKS